MDYQVSYLYTFVENKLLILGAIELDFCDANDEIRLYRIQANGSYIYLAKRDNSYAENHYSSGIFPEPPKNYVDHYWKKHALKFLEFYLSE